MILIDRRVGSGHLAGLWPEAQLADLRSADVAIMGRGPGGVGMSCGVEIKGLKEIMADIYTGRFMGAQAPLLRRSYDQVWLIVQGRGRRGAKGLLEAPVGKRGYWKPMRLNPRSKRAFAHGTFLALVMTVVQKAGIHVWWTDDEAQTLDFLQGLAAWWTTGWDGHASLDRFYGPPPTEPVPAKHRLLRLWLKELPGVGWARSKDAMGQFDSAQAMANADVQDFAAIKGVSVKRAEQIVRGIRE